MRVDRIKKLKVWKTITVFLILLAVSAGIAFYLYVGAYYHAEKQDYAATEETGDFLIYGERDSACGLILYPGGKVEECAYAPILSMLADNGVCCVVAKMPCHLAVFSPDAADRIMEEIPAVKHWYIGGHSLGGAMAADFAAENHEKFSGLVLLAAYPTKELKTIPVLSIYGSEDGVLNLQRYKTAMTYADSMTEYVIEGGNHAGFGNYGEQKGDGSAKITKEEQWRETVSYILSFLRETGGVAEDVYTEIPIDFPFRELGQSYSLTLVSKETKEKTDREYELRLYDETGEILQRISCGVLTEPIAFSYDGSILTVEDQDTYQIKELCQVNRSQECVEKIRGWKLQRDTGMLEIWDYLDDRSLYRGIVALNEAKAPANQEYYDMLFFDGIYVRSERQEEITVPTWIDEPRTGGIEESEGMEGFEYMQKAVFGNDGHTEEYESREALLADFGFEDSAPIYQYFDRYQNLQMELYRDESSEQFCGIVYDYHMTDEKEKRAQMQGFTINSVRRQKWAGADTFSMKTVFGDEGEAYTRDYKEIMEYTPDGLPDQFCYQKVKEVSAEASEEPCSVVKINYVYRDNRTLFCREYWHDSVEFGTTLCSLDSFYDESGRVVYEKGYITHGELEYYYIYADEGEKPAYCLSLDHNVGYVIPNIVQYY